MNTITMLTYAETALPAVLSASISAAALVVVVQAIVWMANARLSPRWCHALWLVVFARLALPVLPEVPPSITPPKPTAHAVAEYISTLEADVTPPDLGQPPKPTQLGGQELPPVMTEAPVMAATAPDPMDSSPASWPWKRILAAIWLAGATGMLAVVWLSAWSTVRRWRRLSQVAPPRVVEVFKDLCEELRLRKCPDVVMCPTLSAPVLAGLWRPRILLPVEVVETFSAQQLRHVLAHELGHLRRRDLWLHAFVVVVQSLHWFNPFAWYAASRVRAAAERCCDEWVLLRLSLKQGRDYADTLLRVLENPGRAWPLPGIAAMAESKADLKQRIRALATWGALPRRWMFASACIVGLLAFLVLTVPGAQKGTLDEQKTPPLPTAEFLVTVLDAREQPLAGAMVKMAGMRVAENPGASYGWKAREGIPLSFTTGKDGRASLKYPKELEGAEHVRVISFHVMAEGHVPQRMEIPVDATPPPIRLPRAATLRVRALLPDKTKVLPHFLIQQGSQVDLNQWQNQPDGSQVCTEVPPGAVRLRAVWHDKATGQTWFSKLQTTTLKRGEESRLDLEMAPAQTLKGTLDSTVPRPVRQGSIHAYFVPINMGQNYGLLWQSTTRVHEDGTFAISDCPPEDDAYVAAVCEGYFSTDPNEPSISMQSATKVAAADLQEMLPLVMRPTAKLTVSVTLPDGRPAEGIKVVASPNTHFGFLSTVYGYTGEWVGHKMASASCDEQRQLIADPWSENMFAKFTRTTDAKGEVTFKDLPESSPIVMSSSDEWELPPVEVKGTGYWNRFRTVPLKAGESATTTLSLVKKGTTTIPKPPQQSQVTSSSENTAPVRQYQYVEQAAPTTSPTPDLKAEQVAPDEFAGVVLDAKGKPMKAHVLSYGLDPDKWMPTDEQGRFRYRILAAEGKRTTDLVRIHAKGCSPVTLTQPTGVYGFITMAGHTAVEGVVKDATGVPVKDVVVRMEQDNKCGQYVGKMWCHRMPYREAKTDAQGRYRIFVEQDYYTITVYGHALGTCEHKDVWIPQGEHKKMEFIADPQVKLEADMVDAQTGEPIPDAELCVFFFDKAKRWKADAQGRVTISGIFAGRCEFYPRHPDYARWWSEEALDSWDRLKPVDNGKTKWQRNFDGLTFEVNAPPVERKPVKVFMERAVIVRGRVLDPDGKPVADATVDPAHTGTGNSLTGDTRFSAKTDAEGRYELRLPASNAAQYNLVAHDGKYQEWRKWANGVLPPVRTKPGDVLENIDIHLTRPGIVKGVVLDKEGKPVAGQRVRTSPVEQNENRYYDPETVTDKDGRFILPFVRPGKQYLWAARWNHDPESMKPEDLHIIEVQAGVTLEITAKKYED